MASPSLAEIIAEEMAATAREVQELQRSDAESMRSLTLSFDDYLEVAGTPAKDIPYGVREHLMAYEIEVALVGMVCVREAVGGALSIGSLKTFLDGEACFILKVLISEEATYQDSLNRTLAAVKAGRPCPHRRSFADTRMELYWVLDILRRRPGYAQCPTCRFEHGFWLKSETRELCPVCMEPSDGVLAPCNHALCQECFGDLEMAPVTEFDISTLNQASDPAFSRWVQRRHGGETYRSRVLMCRGVVAYYAQHGLCQRCQTASDAKFEAVFRTPEFHLERFLTDADKETRDSLSDYASNLLRCATKHCRRRGSNRRKNP